MKSKIRGKMKMVIEAEERRLMLTRISGRKVTTEPVTSADEDSEDTWNYLETWVALYRQCI